MVSCRAAFCRRSVTSSLWQRRSRNLRATATAGSDTSYKPKSATDAVERGTQLFQEKNYVEALRLYEEAMAMSPNDDEARAAKYNAACVHAQRKEWQEAVTCLKVAVNKYNLKAKVILEVRALVVGLALSPILQQRLRVGSFVASRHNFNGTAMLCRTGICGHCESDASGSMPKTTSQVWSIARPGVPCELKLRHHFDLPAVSSLGRLEHQRLLHC